MVTCLTMPTLGDLKAAHADLASRCRDGAALADSWAHFSQLARVAFDNPPYHLRLVQNLLAEFDARAERKDIRILDHGCGGGLTLLYLLANGYEGIHGVDIGGWCESWSRLLKGHLGLKGQRFFVYDGHKLPFADNSFDFIFSTQVIEHVRTDVLESFYSEEGRTLAAGGIAYHQVPHRLVPFDSHTRTWFLHYLPRTVWLSVLRLMQQDMTVPEQALFLRWPWTHRRLARRFLGSVHDTTLNRFAGMSDLSAYEGPRSLRKLLGQLLRTPVVGFVGGFVLRNFVMLDTVSRMPLSGASGADRADPKG